MPTNQPVNLIVTSPAFEQNGAIPLQYTCEGDQINPPLHIAAIPHGTLSLAIIAEDPDTAKGTFDHWVLWNIPLTNNIAENTITGVKGTNGAGKAGYYPPCPPSGSHRYYFNVFALDTELELAAGADKKALQQAMDNHIIAKGTLMGRYQKVNK